MESFEEELFTGSGLVEYRYEYTPEEKGDLETAPEAERVEIYEVITEEGEDIFNNLSRLFIEQIEERILNEKKS